LYFATHGSDVKAVFDLFLNLLGTFLQQEQNKKKASFTLKALQLSFDQIASLHKLLATGHNKEILSSNSQRRK